MPATARPLAAALAVLTCALAAGCSGVGAPPSRPEPALSTPLASFDTSTGVVKRMPFCALVAPDALEEALGAVVEPTTWQDGDRLRVAGGRDLVQENGCAWEGEGASARAWVLAPPVTQSLARQLVGEEPGPDCRPVPQAADYGSPSRTLSCADGTVRHAGLFGDAWLTCELTTPEPDPGLAGRWCVAVATAAAR